jgi:hypothetical protein
MDKPAIRISVAMLGLLTASLIAQPAPSPRLVPSGSGVLSVVWNNVQLDDGLRMVSDLMGITVKFAEDVDTSKRYTLRFDNLHLDDMLAAIMAVTKLSYRVLDAKTIIVFAPRP